MYRRVTPCWTADRPCARGQDPTEVAIWPDWRLKMLCLRANDYDPTKTTKGVLEMVYAQDAKGDYIMNARVREAVLILLGT